MVVRSYATVDELRKLSRNGLGRLGAVKTILTLRNPETGQVIEGEEAAVWEKSYDLGGNWELVSSKTVEEEVPAPAEEPSPWAEWFREVTKPWLKPIEPTPTPIITPAPTPVKPGISPGVVNMLILGGVAAAVVAVTMMMKKKK